MSNTDGEDMQKVSLGELLLNAGTRIVDLEKQSNDQVEIITHLDQELASLREQLKEKELDNLKLRNDLADVLEIKEGKGPTALSMLYNQLKQKEDENRELKASIAVLLDELMYESTTGDFWMWARSNEKVPDRIMKIRNDNLSA